MCIPLCTDVIRIPQLAFRDNRSSILVSMTNVTSKAFLSTLCLDVSKGDLAIRKVGLMLREPAVSELLAVAVLPSESFKRKKR
jgi:hypothetical protein